MSQQAATIAELPMAFEVVGGRKVGVAKGRSPLKTRAMQRPR